MPDVWHRHRYHGRRSCCYCRRRSIRIRCYCRRRSIRIRCYCRRRNIRIHCCYCHNHIHNYNGSIHIYKI